MNGSTMILPYTFAPGIEVGREIKYIEVNRKNFRQYCSIIFLAEEAKVSENKLMTAVLLNPEIELFWAHRKLFFELSDKPQTRSRKQFIVISVNDEMKALESLDQYLQTTKK